MGLRFRKSVSLFPGVRLNFGKTGMSVSVGAPGFRKTFHTSGKVTTSVGIPGTGIYYVDTKNPSKQSNENRRTTRTETRRDTRSIDNTYDSPVYVETEPVESALISSSTSYRNDVRPVSVEPVLQIDIDSLKSIHKSSDDSIDWTEVLVSPTPPDSLYNREMWRYYHEVASDVLAGDIDTYLRLIYEVNPLDDLLAYGGNYEFGTDDPNKIEVEFSVNENALATVKKQMSSSAYNNLLQDYVCSVCIRIARDMFALLPITHTIVHAVLNDRTIISVNFDRKNLSKVKFGYIDPSDTLSLFKHNMNYSNDNGFAPVMNIE